MQGGSAGKQRDTKDAVAIQVPYLRVVGLEEEAEGAHSTPVFTCAPLLPQAYWSSGAPCSGIGSQA